MRNENKWKIVDEPDNKSEQLGGILSKQIEETQPGSDCLTDEEMALMAEGLAPKEKQDLWLNHLSTCENCREIFLLTKGLTAEEAQNSKKRRFPTYYKPLAMAASFIIVIVSIYIFYKSSFTPKSAEQLVMMEKVAEPLPAAKPSVTTSSAFKADEEPSAPMTGNIPDQHMEGKKGTVRSDSREKKQQSSEKKEETLQEIPEESLIRFQDAQQNIERKETNESSDKMQAKDSQNSKQISNTNTGNTNATNTNQQASNIMAPSPNYAMPIKIRQSTKKEKANDKEKDSETATGGALQYSLGAQATPEEKPLQELKKQVETYPSAIPTAQLEQLFKDTLDITKRINQKNYLTEKRADDSKVKQNGEEEKITPPIINQLIKVEKGNLYFPDMKYFLSRSAPGSVEYRFFTLAVAGWCDEMGIYHGIEKEKAVLMNRLNEWKALFPVLNGVYKQIAIYTTSYLEKKTGN